VKNPFIFISYAADDRVTARIINQRLKDTGYETWFDEDKLKPGQDLRQAIEKGLARANIFLFLTSNASLKSSWVQSEIKTALDHASRLVFTVPVLLESITVKDWPFQAATTPPVRFYESDGWDQLLDNLQFFKVRQTQPRSLPQSSLYLSQVEVVNIRCFERFKWSLKSRDGLYDQALILGENSLGKTTLLCCIALGLCNQSGATALLKDAPGAFIRRGKKSGSIKVILQDPKSGLTCEILTELSLRNDGLAEMVRQQVTPEENFPHTDIFICGYGLLRARTAEAGYDSYTRHHGVKTLFCHDATLQDPALILLRQTPDHRQVMEEKLLNILELGEGTRIHYPNSRIAFENETGSLPFQALSDGLRATAQWVLDLMAWLIYANRFESAELGAGLVLLDMPEQNLHPKRQRRLFTLLREQFPHLQFIAATHAPMIASGMAGHDDGIMLKLEKDSTGRVQGKNLPTIAPAHRADQILTSPGFGLNTSRSLAYESVVQRFQILGEKERSATEQKEFKSLQSEIKEQLTLFETPLAQAVYGAVIEILERGTDVVDEDARQEVKSQVLDLLRERQP